MCTLTATPTVTEALVTYEDGLVYVAYELACGCVKLRAATLADLERGLPLLEGQTDTDSGGEDEIAATSPALLTLAA